MSANYKIVFSLTVSHSYYEDSVCPCLDYLPLPDTEKCMDRYGFKLRYRTDGFDLFVNTRQSLPQYLNYISRTIGQESFDFKIVSKHTAFWLFTELPLNQTGSWNYNSNSSEYDPQKKHFLLASAYRPESSDDVFAIIHIAFNDLIKVEEAPHYEIRFSGRSTQWHYFIVNRSALNLDDAFVSSKSGITFTRLGKTVLQSGEEALWFTSDQHLIPMSENPQYKFDLVSTPRTNSLQQGTVTAPAKVIFKGLPNPNPLNIGTIQVNGKEQATSQMYVYV